MENPKTTFEKFPAVEVASDVRVAAGWTEITRRIRESVSRLDKGRAVLVVECYHGVFLEEVKRELTRGLSPARVIAAESLYRESRRVREMVFPDVTDDRLFGFMTRLEIDAYFDPGKLRQAKEAIASHREGLLLVIGTGAALVPPAYDLLVYADMARWEIQSRMRAHEISNIGVSNKDSEDWSLLYKQGYFVDWRLCDRLKKKLAWKWDFLLDTNDRRHPKLVEGRAVIEGMQQCLRRPFSVVPFFDPGPWGGQWLKKVCGLDAAAPNYAWCFNCVPEENSLLLRFGETVIEIPSVNLVYFDPRALLGDEVHARFGDEFPIRFDYLDTMEGGNLSLQVHPLTEYIQEKFGMRYTQDESYYLMEAGPGAVVYLGLKEGVKPDQLSEALRAAQHGAPAFDAERYIQTWPVKKHDHYLIPGGTVHCSGKDSVVLEISATPYIFTFKLWDWGRLGLDGRPRPINIDHGMNVIQWERTTSWTQKNLVNRIEQIASGDGWTEERTGLHEREFIETRRHWFTRTVPHPGGGGVNVLTLVEGSSIVIESPSGTFAPFTVRYAETFIVPAGVGGYTISPGQRGERCATIKAFVRTKAG